jgi:phosphoribosylformylglycinamidine synthase
MEVWIEEKEWSKAEEQVQDMCHKLLANPVIEDFRFELEEI